MNWLIQGKMFTYFYNKFRPVNRMYYVFKAHRIISFPWAENYEPTQGAHTWAGSAWRKSEWCDNDTEKYFWATIYNGVL
jgi:hypothetical protein